MRTEKGKESKANALGVDNIGENPISRFFFRFPNCSHLKLTKPSDHGKSLFITLYNINYIFQRWSFCGPSVWIGICRSDRNFRVLLQLQAKFTP